jgi:hypothetical protein
MQKEEVGVWGTAHMSHILPQPKGWVGGCLQSKENWPSWPMPLLKYPSQRVLLALVPVEHTGPSYLKLGAQFWNRPRLLHLIQCAPSDHWWVSMHAPVSNQ